MNQMMESYILCMLAHNSPLLWSSQGFHNCQYSTPSVLAQNQGRLQVGLRQDSSLQVEPHHNIHRCRLTRLCWCKTDNMFLREGYKSPMLHILHNARCLESTQKTFCSRTREVRLRTLAFGGAIFCWTDKTQCLIIAVAGTMNCRVARQKQNAENDKRCSGPKHFQRGEVNSSVVSSWGMTVSDFM